MRYAIKQSIVPNPVALSTYVLLWLQETRGSDKTVRTLKRKNLRAFLCDQWKYSLWAPLSREGTSRGNSWIDGELSLSLFGCASSQECLSWEVPVQGTFVVSTFMAWLVLESPIPKMPTWCHRLVGLWLEASYVFVGKWRSSLPLMWWRPLIS